MNRRWVERVERAVEPPLVSVRRWHQTRATTTTTTTARARERAGESFRIVSYRIVSYRSF